LASKGQAFMTVNHEASGAGLGLDWRQRFADRIATVEEAIRLLRPGRRIFIGSGAAQPVRLVDAMVRCGTQLADNEIVHILTLGPAPYAVAECADRFRHNAFFIGANTRAAVREGRADFTPVFLSEIPDLLRSGRAPVDAALVQVSLPDAEGYSSLGVSVDVVRAAVDSARIVIAEVNPRMPRTRGDTRIDLHRCAALVPVDAPLLERLPPEPDDVSRAIGETVADLVPDGATLQVGIGRAPSAILKALRGHRDLGIHTEMLSDGILDLVRAGAVTGRRKSLLPGKLVASFLMGSNALYAWADENEQLHMGPSDWVNDPQVIARNDRMVSINTALSVDLTGQVAADTLESGFYSGIGGQVDFVRGAARSKGGRSFIVFPSLARDGTVSRIQAVFPEGAAVVTSRGDVRYIVTEYGVADLWGKSVRERALALVAIAHPDHREELLNAAKGRHWVLPDQPVPKVPFETRHWDEVLADGAHVRVRAARQTDESKVHALLYALSPESVYQRYFTARQVHPRSEVLAVLDTDPRSSCALVAERLEDSSLLGVARYDLDQTSRMGELGIVVAEGWQKRGVGTALVRRLVDVGKRNGVKGLRADVLASNHGMIGVLRRVGVSEVPLPEAGICALQLTFPADSPA
jgi:acyl-CoA hydrolase/RimJ/RimL family protein N-acetyltransferase